jgi:prevent-host-death family protein
MKVISIRAAKASLSNYMGEAQQDPVLITRDGKPAALMIGVEGEQLEDLLTVANPRFWELVESRRRSSKRVSIAEVRRRLGTSRKVKSPRRKRSRA